MPPPQLNRSFSYGSDSSYSPEIDDQGLDRLQRMMVVRNRVEDPLDEQERRIVRQLINIDALISMSREMDYGGDEDY